MNRTRLSAILAVAFAALLLSSYSEGPFFYGAGNRTGSAGSPTGCSEPNGCHSSASINAVLSIQLLDSLGNSAGAYQPGHTYQVLLSELVPGNTRPRFGFQASVVKASDGATQAGTLSAGNRPDIAVYNAPPQLAEHTSPLPGTPAGGDVLDTVSFLWTAPDASFGRVRVYAVLNAVDYNGDSTGDRWRATTAEFDPAPTAVAGPQTHRSWRLFPNPAQNVVQLLGLDRNAAVQIMDGSARIVAQARSDADGEASINVQALPAGPYLLHSTSGGQSVWQRFVRE